MRDVKASAPRLGLFSCVLVCIKLQIGGISWRHNRVYRLDQGHPLVTSLLRSGQLRLQHMSSHSARFCFASLPKTLQAFVHPLPFGHELRDPPGPPKRHPEPYTPLGKPKRIVTIIVVFKGLRGVQNRGHPDASGAQTGVLRSSFRNIIEGRMEAPKPQTRNRLLQQRFQKHGGGRGGGGRSLYGQDAHLRLLSLLCQ